MRRALAALAALLVVTGCSAVPISGSVVHESRGAQQLNEPGVAISPDPPVRGATPALIVDGFLHAMASSQGGYAAARQYLTPEAQASWQPGSQVVIYADGYSPKPMGEGVVLDAPLIGRVGPDGAFITLDQASVSHDFGLLKDADGQWRISRPPSGLLMSNYLFTTSFSRTITYFVDPTSTTLVPDPLYVARQERSPTRAIKTLLAGPTAWLRPAVVSQIPAGTTLTGPVEVDPLGVATVPLSGEVRSLGDRGRSLMFAQLGWTFRQFPEIRAVRVTTDGQALQALGGRSDGSVSQSVFDAYDPAPIAGQQLYGLAGGRLVTVADQDAGMTATPVAGAFGSARPEAVTFAVSADGKEAAVVTETGEVLVSGVTGGDIRTVTTIKGLLRPQYTRLGELWLVAMRDGRTTVSRVVGGRVEPVRADGLLGVSVHAFRISPDGTRMAVAGTVGGKAAVGVLRILRNDGVRLEAWRPLALADLTVPHDVLPDVAWASPTSLLVLAANLNPEQAEAYLIEQDGSAAADLGRSDGWGAVSVAAVPRAGGRVVILGAGDRVWRYEETYRWTPVLTGFSALGYPG